VQGQLREGPLLVRLTTECAHCSRPLQMEIDRELNFHVDEEAVEPLVFMPHVDWGTFKEPNIIQRY
jgi:hypothetical protein